MNKYYPLTPTTPSNHISNGTPFFFPKRERWRALASRRVLGTQRNEHLWHERRYKHGVLTICKCCCKSWAAMPLSIIRMMQEADPEIVLASGEPCSVFLIVARASGMAGTTLPVPLVWGMLQTSTSYTCGVTAPSPVTTRPGVSSPWSPWSFSELARRPLGQWGVPV